MKKKMEDLEKVSHVLAEKVYARSTGAEGAPAGPAPGAEAGGAKKGPEGAVETDFEVVDEDEGKK
jgi:hypothetical protein